MLYFLVVLTAFNALKQWSPVFGPQATFHYSVGFCLLTNTHHLLRYTPACTMYNTFPSLELTLDDDSLSSILHLYYVGLANACNPGFTTHNRNPGFTTCNCNSGFTTRNCNPDFTTRNFNPGPVTCNGIKEKLYDPSCLFDHITVMHDAYKMTENGCFKSISDPVDALLQLWIVQKPHKKFKCSAWPLILAINRSIYYLLNSTFNQAHDVKHLINRLLLMLQQYITRHNDFKIHWFKLLLSSLLRSQHISLWFVTLTCLRISVLAQKLFRIQKIIYEMKMLMAYTRSLSINKITMLSSSMHFLYFKNYFRPTTLHSSSRSPLLSDQKIKTRTGILGGGSSARTEYGFLKPYVVSMEIQLKNPDQFNYVYGSHQKIDKAMQEIQTSGEPLLVCSIPLALVANILTSIQANEVVKEHNLCVSKKALAEKRKVIETHVCTISCSQHVTVFKPVKKNQKSIRRQCSDKIKVKEIKTHPKVGRKSQGKISRVARNYKYYIRENIKFPPSPPSRRLMHKIISGFCNDIHPSKFEEAGCAVCGQLVAMTELVRLTDVKISFDPLVRIGVTRLPRKSMDDPIKEMEGPILDENCKHVCHICIGFLKKKVTMSIALDLTNLLRLFHSCVKRKVTTSGIEPETSCIHGQVLYQLSY